MKTPVVLLTIALLFLQWNAGAVTRQGLYWGVGVDDQLSYSFAYSLTSGNNSDTFEDSVYIQIRSLPSIPESIESWEDLRYPVCRVNFANGTPLDIESYPELGSILATVSARPIGNWSLMSRILLDRFTDIPGVVSHNMTDETGFWGYEYSIQRNGTGYTSSGYYSDNWYRKDGSYSHGIWRWSYNWSTDGLLWYCNIFALSLQRSDVGNMDAAPASVALATMLVSLGLIAVERGIRAQERTECDHTVMCDRKAS